MLNQGAGWRSRLQTRGGRANFPARRSVYQNGTLFRSAEQASKGEWWRRTEARRTQTTVVP